MAECEGPESKTMEIILPRDLPLCPPFIYLLSSNALYQIEKFTPQAFKKYNLFSIKSSSGSGNFLRNQ